MEILQSSPRALALITAPIGTPPVTARRAAQSSGRLRYPWYSCPVGMSFVVRPVDADTTRRLREAAQYIRRATGMRYAVLTHREYDCTEVARIA